MKTIKEKEIFPVNAQAIWDIISDPTNSSWVPTVEEITLDGTSDPSLWRAWES